MYRISSLTILMSCKYACKFFPIIILCFFDIKLSCISVTSTTIPFMNNFAIDPFDWKAIWYHWLLNIELFSDCNIYISAFPANIILLFTGSYINLHGPKLSSNDSIITLSSWIPLCILIQHSIAKFPSNSKSL